MKFALAFLCVFGGMSFESEAASIHDQDNFDWAKQIFKKNNTRQDGCPSCQCGIANTGGSRIVDGHESQPLIYPWMLYLHIVTEQGNARCGASLITEWHALTAAHCMITDKKNMAVLAWRHNLAQPGEFAQERKVAEIRIHEKWAEQGGVFMNNDIAIIKFDEKFDLSPTTKGPQMRPVCLPQAGEENDGKIGTSPGWGYIYDGGPTSNILMETELPILTHEKCMAVMGNKVTENMLCGNDANKDTSTCRGDSGGPLLLKDETTSIMRTVGIVSYGIFCGDRKFPSIFTKVANYVDWIKEHTKDGCYCTG